MFSPENDLARARRENPQLDAAYKKAEDAVERYIEPLIAFFNALEVEIAEMPIAQRFSRVHGPTFEFSEGLGIPNPSILDLNEADYKRAQLSEDLERNRSRALSIADNIKSIVLDIEATKQEDMPTFEAGGVVTETAHFKVVMDWKAGLEESPEGKRFFVEPKTDGAERMLVMAAVLHNIQNFSERQVVTADGTIARPCLRADFTFDNLPALLQGVVTVPEPNKDSVPPPLRMEECLRLHPDNYTFS